MHHDPVSFSVAPLPAYDVFDRIDSIIGSAHQNAAGVRSCPGGGRKIPVADASSPSRNLRDQLEPLPHEHEPDELNEFPGQLLLGQSLRVVPAEAGIIFRRDERVGQRVSLDEKPVLTLDVFAVLIPLIEDAVGPVSLAARRERQREAPHASLIPQHRLCE